MLSLQQFRILLAIRDAGSLTKAAENLGYGAPTVTHHLNLLEAHFGAVLVERGSRGVSFTPLGEVTVREAETIMARVDDLERIIAEHRDAGLVTLRVGTFASLGSKLLPPAIRELQSTSSVRIEVIEAEPLELVDLLRRGELDAALLYDLADDPSILEADLELLQLLREPYNVLVASEGPLAQAKKLDFAQLASASWVRTRQEDEATERVLLRACRSAGFLPKEFIRSDDLSMIHGLVSEGLCLAIMTESAANSALGVELKPTVQNLGERSVYFATRTGHLPAAVIQLRTLLVGFTS
ncbi:DNA-binding transcriptional LysR family regulator [Aurantimicrobium minutum]|uniref:LysR family transcriptional regulator n=1 Tax=Aurantimicrobium minutum TaxID=708131 RepID=UPI002406F0DF|nr:LysR family transcriptional regulator [Aurantimicrobium minutum]MDF9809671.1 DNA-binding transcriptional LysR family regulator [Aurantimicrobium minutum]